MKAVEWGVQYSSQSLSPFSLTKWNIFIITETVFRIRIEFMRIRIQLLKVNSDPDPDWACKWMRIYVDPDTLKKMSKTNQILHFIKDKATFYHFYTNCLLFILFNP
jgi:hypothetical protein